MSAGARELAAHEAHFESLARQREAARLGTWIFLASEVLLFAGLFTLYAAQRAEHPRGFAEGIRHADVIAGSVNTFVLLGSSFLVAAAVHLLRDGRRRMAAWLTAGTIALGLVFLGLKAYEYARHAREGALPGGRTPFYLEHPEEGLAAYFNLYWVSTSLHAVHVIVGLGVLAWLLLAMLRRRLGGARAHRLEMGALYWHLVDSIWIFLWPLFYLLR
ncbi:MAG TPA: cytochrome c oxidase subunit 3 [Sandaracinaceae bacterium]